MMKKGFKNCRVTMVKSQRDGGEVKWKKMHEEIASRNYKD